MGKRNDREEDDISTDSDNVLVFDQCLMIWGLV